MNVNASCLDQKIVKNGTTRQGVISGVMTIKAKYKNKFERKLASQLKKCRIKHDYECDRIPYILARFYVPDFTCYTSRGILYIEAKGYLRPEHKAKMVAVKKQHPEKDVRIVFYSKNKKNEKWAIKNGFTYAFENIPLEWLE